MEKNCDVGLVARGLQLIEVDGPGPIHLHMLIFIGMTHLSLRAGMMNMEHSIECVVRITVFIFSPWWPITLH